MRRVFLPLILLLAPCALLCWAPSARGQGPVPELLALDLDAKKGGKGHRPTAESFTRHVATHLVPLLEGMGYVVERVHDANRAIEDGDYHLALQVDLSATPIWLVHEARQFDDHVQSDHERGVSAWAEYRIFGWRDRKEIAKGEIGAIDSRVHDPPGAGKPIMDDEESVARVFAGELADAAGEVFRAYDEPPELRFDEDE